MGSPLPELIAPARWRAIDFISDLHLSPDTPLTVAAWADYMHATAADAIFILGDLFEAWPGDDARHEGFEARCGAVLREAAATRDVAFLVGNRDFLVGADALADWGVRALADPTVLVAFGQRVMLSHGDEWCLADTDYQRVRRMVRDPAWQAEVLAKPLAVRRMIAAQMRSESEAHQRGQRDQIGQGGQGGRMLHDGVDVDRATAWQAMRAASAPTLIHGHTHRPGSERYAAGFCREVLTDWDLDHASAPRAEVLRWQAGTLARIAPMQAGVIA